MSPAGRGLPRPCWRAGLLWECSRCSGGWGSKPRITRGSSVPSVLNPSWHPKLPPWGGDNPENIPIQRQTRCSLLNPQKEGLFTQTLQKIQDWSRTMNKFQEVLPPSLTQLHHTRWPPPPPRQASCGCICPLPAPHTAPLTGGFRAEATASAGQSAQCFAA